MSETVTDALNTIRAVVEAGRAAEDRLLEIRRQLPQYDCRYTGGPVADSGGKHCPPESPCLTCRCERAADMDDDWLSELIAAFEGIGMAWESLNPLPDASPEVRALMGDTSKPFRERWPYGIAEWAKQQIDAARHERDTLRAEVERLKWQQAGSPMRGETPLNE